MADITGILKALNDATETITGATSIKALGGAVTTLKVALTNLTNIVQERSSKQYFDFHFLFFSRCEQYLWSNSHLFSF